MIAIPSDERGTVRLFALDMPPDQAAQLRDDPGPEDGPAPLQSLLGARYLDTDFVEIFDLSNLEGLGLVRYLTEGNGIAEADLAPDRAQLEALTGWVLIVYSSAFGGFAQTLNPGKALRPIGMWREARSNTVAAPLKSDAATTPSNLAPAAKPAPSNAAILGRVATYVLLVIFALTLLMIWIA